MNHPDQSRPPHSAPPEIAGKWVVLGIFGFAFLVVGGLYAYWYMHRAPFLPLQQALADEFPDSGPLVEGGQRKIHKNTPPILRITMKVEFDPVTEEEQARHVADRVYDFVAGQTDLAKYDTFELHLFWPEPEQELRQIMVAMPIGPTESLTAAVEELEGVRKATTRRYRRVLKDEPVGSTIRVALDVDYDPREEPAENERLTGEVAEQIAEAGFDPPFDDLLLILTGPGATEPARVVINRPLRSPPPEPDAVGEGDPVKGDAD